MKISTCELTWFEDQELLEWWEYDDPHSRKAMECNILDAIEFARNEKVLLIIQPEFQDQCIFVDFSE